MSQVRNKLLTFLAIVLEFGALIWYVLMYNFSLTVFHAVSLFGFLLGWVEIKP